MKWLAGLPPAYRVTVLAAVAVLAAAGFDVARGLFVAGTPQALEEKDFANYWMAARLALEGRALDLFGPQEVYFAHLTATFGEGYGWHNWSYPPHALPILWPLGLIGYEAAAVLFLVATGLLFLWALRAFAGRGLLPLVAAGPFAAHTVWTVQNGFLTAGLALGALALRDRRPVAAGLLLGLLTIKPQLGLLFPLLLVAERRWSMIASAAATALALAGLSAALFGMEAWRGYLAEVLPYQNHVMRALEGPFLAMNPSVYGMLRNWGVDPDRAMTLHLALAAPVALLAAASFFVVKDGRDRTIVLLVATFLITPYAQSYDLGLLAGALALLATRPASGRLRQGVLAAAMLLPLLMTPLGGLGIPLAPPLLLAVLALAMADARPGIVLSPDRRGRASS